ncbi:hypothetical protein [Agromyces sp. NPDC058126]|uniref:hypothetical protein n=1 Tax=Agromyces sp. NPDC058126 TaxID=3346350 RepID=UPI0036DA5BA0
MTKVRRTRWALILSVLTVVVTAGCAQLPPYETARDEARDDMQAVVDLLPDGAVERLEDPIPRGFVSCGDARQYTGRWLVYLTDPAGIEAIAHDLRNDVGAAGFVEDETLDNRDDRFATRRGGDDSAPLVGVSVDEDLDGTSYLEVMGFARCSQAPDEAE